jgi:hypothetical protein
LSFASADDRILPGGFQSLILAALFTIGEDDTLDERKLFKMIAGEYMAQDELGDFPSSFWLVFICHAANEEAKNGILYVVRV